MSYYVQRKIICYCVMGCKGYIRTLLSRHIALSSTYHITLSTTAAGFNDCDILLLLLLWYKPPVSFSHPTRSAETQLDTLCSAAQLCTATLTRNVPEVPEIQTPVTPYAITQQHCPL